jgi:predicted RNA-binding Zn-ribbon protein involved in translation (DUF1610 family)
MSVCAQPAIAIPPSWCASKEDFRDDEKTQPDGQSLLFQDDLPAAQCDAEEDDCPLDVNGLGRCDGADCPSVCCRKNAAVFFAAAAAQAKNQFNVLAGGCNVMTEDDLAKATQAVIGGLDVQLGASKAGELPSMELCVDRPRLLDSVEMPTCSSCGEKCSPTEMQTIFRCKTCNRNRVRLNRVYGSWPSDSFKCLNKEEQLLFYQNAKGAHSHAALLQKVEEVLARSHAEVDRTSEGGTYLPLSVLKQQGFDTALIERDCKDTRQHPLLGATYNVDLLSKSRDEVVETKRSEKRSNEYAVSSASSTSSSAESSRPKKKQGSKKHSKHTKKAKKNKAKGSKNKAKGSKNKAKGSKAKGSKAKGTT